MRRFHPFFSSSAFTVPAVLLVCFASRAFAQVDRAGLNGTVTDPAGRVIPGIHVIVSMPDTGLIRETDTSRAGTYEVPELPVGSYTVTFTGVGFAPFILHQVMQTAGHTRTLDATMRAAGPHIRSMSPAWPQSSTRPPTRWPGAPSPSR